MPTATVEMMPVEFALVNCTGALVQNDLVTLSGDHGDLKGRIVEVKTKTYGRDQEPGTAAKIAITKGDLKPFSTPRRFQGYIVSRHSDGMTGTVRTPCLVSYKTQLISRAELQKMLDTGLELIAKASKIKKSDYAVKWFGQAAFEGQELATINRRCAELHGSCEALTSVIFQCAQGETLGAISTTDPLRNGPSCRIQLGRGLTYDRYSWGERVCTIVHELTHWFLDTVDAQMADGTDCYGLDCMRLAKSPNKTERAKALNNADNWAYYICEYRSAGDNRDWRNFTENEIRERGPFVSNGYNVAPGLMASHA